MININFADFSQTTPPSDWVEINNKLIKFPDRAVREVTQIYENEAVVHATLKKHRNKLQDGGIFCIDSLGKILWKVEPPKRVNGDPLYTPYQDIGDFRIKMTEGYRSGQSHLKILDIT